MKPIIFRHSKVPKFCSFFSSINTTNITFGPFIFCEADPSEGTIRHESIHVHQYMELGILGFFPVYLYDYIHAMIKYRNDYEGYSSLGHKAYMMTRMEQEAYANHFDKEYLDNREKFSWYKNYKV